MRCPFCRKSDLKTLETREVSETTNRRRKECNICKKRFTTYETIELAPLTVIKQDSSKQPFDRDKILIGVKKACEKRDVPEEKIQALVGDVIDKINSLDTREITSKKIGLYVLNRLKKLDKIAYVRFASVYRDFEDISELEQELNRLQK